MSDSFVTIPPYADRPKQGKDLAGVGLTEFYKRLNQGRYQSFLDGNNRMVVVESIFADQRRLAEERGTPRSKPSKARKGGPGHPKTKT